jgi:hypothetical protein
MHKQQQAANYSSLHAFWQKVMSKNAVKGV